MDSFRVQKAQALRAEGVEPYAASFDRSHTLQEARDMKDGTRVRIAGRIMLLGDMGKMTFATLQDHTGRLQIALRSEDLGKEAYERMLSLVDLGDFIGIAGERFVTKTNEPTVAVQEWTMLSKALRQPPEKLHRIADQEPAWPQRYLDLTSHRETFDRFVFRSRFVQKLREFYWSKGFLEMETP